LVSRTLLLIVAMAASLAVAQTAPKTQAHAPATPAAHAAAAHPAANPPALPPGVPPVRGPIKPMFSLRYQEITIGTGPLAEPQKVYRVAYTGWLVADGRKFDASADHSAQPVYGHDLQVVKGEDGKPKMEAGQPMLFVQGRGQVVPGFDNAFDGMHVGGKRRVFIPYQLAYGASGRPTGDPKNPGIPPKADLIFDMELVDMMDMPQQAAPPPARPTPPPPAPPAGTPPNPAK